MKSLFALVLKTVLSFLFVTVLILSVYGRSMTLYSTLRAFRIHFPAFLYSTSSILPAIVISYMTARYLSFTKSRILEILSKFLTSFPVFVISVFLQGIVWLRIFEMTSYHNEFLDFLSTFVPTFFTLFLVITFHVYSFMKPLAEKITKLEFVRTMRSVGISERKIKKKLFKNIDIEFSRILIYLTPLFLGESVVVEKVYNFRGVGYELVRSMKELNTSSIISLSVYFFIILIMAYLFSWMVGERWAERVYR